MGKRRLWLPAAALGLMITLLAPAGAMAAGQSDTSAYAETQKEAADKAALLTGTTYNITSVQYALIDHGRIVVSGQTGRNDEKGKKPLTADTMYGIGSTSKMFTTAAVMKLVDEGKIDLDTPVVHYIPDFTMKDERYKQITPRMLLNHSSGLYGSTLGNAFLFEDNDTYAHDTFLEHLASQKLKADPGAYSVYSNDGFTLAEILVERVSGMDFTSFIHQYITQPLGMSDTITPLDKVNTAPMAGLYYPSFKGQLPNETVNSIGAGGIYSTAEDLVRFSQMFTGQTEGLLSDLSVQAMEQAEYKRGMWPPDADNIVGYGLGWDSVDLFPFGEYGIQALAKGGDTILYHASLVVLPGENMAAAVLSSGGSSTTDQMLAADILLHALKEKGEIAAFKPDKSFGQPVKAPMPEELESQAGMYGATNQLIKAEISTDSELSITSPQAPASPAQTFVYTADGTFMSADGSTKASFVKEKNGQTYLWVRQYASLPGLGQIAVSQYSAEKLEPNDITPDTAAAWAARSGKQYLLISEKYSSEVYMALPAVKVNLFPDAPGYMLDQKITGPNSSDGELQIPVMAGRDNQAFTFFTQDGAEYLQAADSLYVREDALKPIYAGKKSALTIPSSGYSRWLTVPEQAAGKTMDVKMPKHASFAVYDDKGACVYYSIIGGGHQVTLPANGKLMFAGDAGVKMEITIK
ncbi:serine hydrolase domain-containing protein [Paenibacillus humicola]|uniref:serine hydrolase domain-containing protein n=1 Tax=Paenibacillus humicola TaxID=3110540 RepID=UPI00237BAD05|nr:serine hydrolase domain-containing protein [Paenibacillus humicola]